MIDTPLGRSRRPMPRLCGVLLVGALAGCAGPATVLDKEAQLARFDWWDNRDVDWFAERIPFLETPDAELDAVYYYRWEVLTKHLVYGAPEHGYTLTEFIDRPFWSGAYGAISCPLGHQMYELRWLKDRRVVEDFARYWFEVPGAEPRSYSNWYADAVWATYRVLGDPGLIATLLPHMEAQHAGWMAERWDPEHGMFRWDGMHDGMETNIDSRQTPRWFDGAVGYRPTLNSYLWADRVALAKAHALVGNAERAAAFERSAADLKERIQRELWDPKREFFFQQFAEREETVADPWPGAGNRSFGNAAVAGARIAGDGSTPPVEARSLTYETGPWAGSPHGREEIGFVPWQFGLPDPGYEGAWKFLMDPEYFGAPFGPTTAERNDPLFYVSPRCCVWSGNSWPYATSQTLTAMANLLNDYAQDHVDADDYYELLRRYARTQWRAGRPYVAEAADPDSGSWEGHDSWYHSEHYLHSSYVDLLITGLIGLRPRDDEVLEVNPLAPRHWDWFALDDVAYRGHRVSVLWDRDGSRYGRGAGLSLIVDGTVRGAAPGLGRVAVELPVSPAATPVARRHNLAVRNGVRWFPSATASSSRPEAPPAWAVDGNVWYHRSPPNRWVSDGGNATDWFEVDFGVRRRIDAVKLYFLDDTTAPPEHVGERAPATWAQAFAEAPPATPPAAYRVMLPAAGGSDWIDVPGQSRALHEPTGRRADTVSFPAVETEVLRVLMQHRPGGVSGLSEIEIWGDGELPLAPPARTPRNVAFSDGRVALPRATASWESDATPTSLLTDGEIAFNLYTRKVWTALGSAAASDWIELRLAGAHTVDAVDLYLWAWEDRGTAAPRSYRIQAWSQGAWADVADATRTPRQPLAMARNRVRFAPVTTARLRVLLEHARPSVSALSEIVVWGKA